MATDWNYICPDRAFESLQLHTHWNWVFTLWALFFYPGSCYSLWADFRLLISCPDPTPYKAMLKLEDLEQEVPSFCLTLSLTWSLKLRITSALPKSQVDQSRLLTNAQVIIIMVSIFDGLHRQKWCDEPYIHCFFYPHSNPMSEASTATLYKGDSEA